MHTKQLVGLGAIILLIGATLLYFLFIYQPEQSYDEEMQQVRFMVKEDLQQYNMIKRIRNEQGENRGILEPKENFTKPERVSHYQGFVTPNHPAVIQYVQQQGIFDVASAYATAVQWTWVSDVVMHNKIDWWLKPRAFILDTPNITLYPNSPVEGIASDCESQAYTLVSIIEATGFPKENVRVVIGTVNFSGEPSGHAWVQIYEQGNWYELEATSGPYWDEDTNTLIDSAGAAMKYFKNYPYPVESYTAFFNDVYYYQPDSGIQSQNLPSHWSTTEKQFSLAELRELRQQIILQQQ